MSACSNEWLEALRLIIMAVMLLAVGWFAAKLLRLI